MLSSEERKTLLEIARSTLTEHLRAGPRPAAADLAPVLRQPRAVFVTLRKLGELRGCIGSTKPDRPLADAVADLSISAGLHDSRFPPVRLEELPEIRFEISLLESFQLVADVSEIEVGRHGLFLEKGQDCGLLLPQVAVEFGWTREQFLEHACQKAHLAAESWKEPGVRISRFEAEVFGEEDAGGRSAT